MALAPALVAVSLPWDGNEIYWRLVIGVRFRDRFAVVLRRIAMLWAVGLMAAVAAAPDWTGLGPAHRGSYQ